MGKKEILKGAPSMEEFFKKFKDTNTIYDFMFKYMYPWERPVCPYCGCTKNVYKEKKRKATYHCMNCNHRINLLNGTVFEDLQHRPKAWLYFFYNLFVCRKGISAHQLVRELQVDKSTILNWRRRFQLAMANYDLKPFKGVVQIDELYIYGSNHGRYSREYQGRGQKKYPVFGVYEEGGKRVHSSLAIMDEAGRCLTSAQLKAFIESAVSPGTIVVTDEFKGYNFLNKSDSGYIHKTVNHKLYKYKSEDGFTTNGIEGYWGLVKKHYYSTHQKFDRKWAHLYLEEFDFRYNHHNWNDALEDFLKQAVIVPRVIDIRKMGRHGNKTYALKDYRMILPKKFDDVDISTLTVQDIIECDEPVFGILREPYQTRRQVGCHRNCFQESWQKLGMVEGGLNRHKDYKNHIKNTLDDVYDMLRDATKHNEVNDMQTLEQYKDNIKRSSPKANKTKRMKRIKDRFENAPDVIKIIIKNEYPNLLKISKTEETRKVHGRFTSLTIKYNKHLIQ